MITLAGDAVLKAIATYHFVTVDHLLLLQAASLRTTQERLKHLRDDGYIQRIPRQTTSRGGSLKPAYTLTTAGKRYLESQGHRVPPPHVPKPYFLTHTLQLNDVLIAARVLATRRPQQVCLQRLVHEQELKRWKLPGTIPDAFVSLQVRQRGQWHDFPLLIELDMGTEPQQAWRHKVAGYVQLFATGLTEHFETDVVTVVTISPQGQSRVDVLRRWTEQALRECGGQEFGEVFFFANVALGMTPEELFFSPQCSVAFAGDGRYPLLETS